jgi:rhamnosyltransferase
MTFDVIILTCNSEKRLVKFFNALKKQSLKPNKIIIVDSQSNDSTVEIARENGCEIHIIEKAKFDHGGTRSLAASFSNSDIIVYFTDDALPVNDCSLENIIKVFYDHKIGVAFGRQIPYDDTNLFGKHLRYFNYPEESYMRDLLDKQKYGIKTCFLSNSFSAYRKSALDKVGYFKDGLILGEDTYVGAKLIDSGYRIAYVSDAVVYHSHNYGPIEEFKRYFDIGVFHRKEKWILDEFGKAEGEGIKYIISVLKFISSEKKFYLIPELFYRSFLKYLGYRLGYNYRLIPLKVRRLMSMHSFWWGK